MGPQRFKVTYSSFQPSKGSEKSGRRITPLTFLPTNYGRKQLKHSDEGITPRLLSCIAVSDFV